MREKITILVFLPRTCLLLKHIVEELLLKMGVTQGGAYLQTVQKEVKMSNAT